MACWACAFPHPGENFFVFWSNQATLLHIWHNGCPWIACGPVYPCLIACCACVFPHPGESFPVIGLSQAAFPQIWHAILFLFNTNSVYNQEFKESSINNNFNFLYKQLFHILNYCPIIQATI